MAMNFVV